MKSHDEIKKMFENTGIKLNEKVIFYCTTSVQATVLNAISGEIGCTNHSVYDGAWSEYSQRASK